MALSYIDDMTGMSASAVAMCKGFTSRRQRFGRRR